MCIIADTENKRGSFRLDYDSQTVRDLLAGVELLLSAVEGLFARQIASYWHTLEIRTKTRVLRLVNVLNCSLFGSFFSKFSLRTSQR